MNQGDDRVPRTDKTKYPLSLHRQLVSKSDGRRLVPTGYVHPLAIDVMQEVGVDISSQRSNSILEFLADPPDLIITVCEQAAATCPVFPDRVKRITWAFDDPAKAEGNEEQKLAEFRRVRDEIRDRIASTLDELLI